MRHDDIGNPANDLGLWRFDALPTIRAPLSNWPFLSVATSASWRLTHWLERRDPTLPTRPQIRRRPHPAAARSPGRPHGPDRSRRSSRRRPRTATPNGSSTSSSRGSRSSGCRRSIGSKRSSIRASTTSTRSSAARRRVSYSLTNRVLARRKRPGGVSEVRGDPRGRPQPELLHERRRGRGRSRTTST